MFSDYVSYLTIGFVGSGISLCVIRLLRSFGNKKCLCIPGKLPTVIITGATSGIGKACADELAKRNCNVIIGCRNVILGQKVIDEIKVVNKNSSMRMIPLDLSDLNSIRNFAAQLSKEPIDVLINNAGVMGGYFRMIQSTKFEEDMTVNYLGPFYLTNLILSDQFVYRRKNGANISSSLRVIFISSSLSKKGKLDLDKPDFSFDAYNPKQAYANSKLALCLFARELHKRYHHLSIVMGCRLNILTMFTGGMVYSNLNRHIISNYSILLQPVIKSFFWCLLKHPTDSCQSIVHCALSDDLLDSSDDLYSHFKRVEWPESVGRSESISADLWLKSCEIVNIPQDLLDQALRIDESK